MDERNVLFKCLNCGQAFEINVGDFVTLKCPKCHNTPAAKSAKLFKEAVKYIYAIEQDREGFGFEFQYPSMTIL